MEPKQCIDSDDWDDITDTEFDIFSDSLVRNDEKEYKRKQIEKKSRMFR